MNNCFIPYIYRLVCENLYYKWITENGIKDKPASVIAFLMANEWLDCDKLINDTRKEIRTDEN